MYPVDRADCEYAREHFLPLTGVEVETPGGFYTREATITYSWYGDLPKTPAYPWGAPRRGSLTETVTCTARYKPENNNSYDRFNFNPRDEGNKPYFFAKVRVTFEGVTAEGELFFRQPKVGHVTLKTDKGLDLKVHTNAAGISQSFTETLGAVQDPYKARSPFSGSDGVPHILRRHLKYSSIEGGPQALWLAFLTTWVKKDVPMDGLSSLYKRKDIAPVLAQLALHKVEWLFFRWLHDKKNSKGQSNNKLLASFLQVAGHDYDLLVAGLNKAMQHLIDVPYLSYWTDHESSWTEWTRVLCQQLPGAEEKIQEIAAKQDFRKRTTAAGQADGLGVLAESYPKLRAAIEDGSLPIGIFNQPSGDPVNREFALWERALNQKGWAPVLKEIAANAARRGTYERDITSYLMFLFKITAYLDKHAKGSKKWRSMPKFVQSQYELEMDEANEDGTVKRRSALTPVADNETRVVTVPYVAMSVTGQRTQWVYSRFYHIFEEGFHDPESQSVVTQDLEIKLNGRDDYGLCYYTLTGTDTARGYPSFLVILERRVIPPYVTDRVDLSTMRSIVKPPGIETFVHFHRVHPSRKKDGVKRPACELIEACYQYMAGNISAKDIAAQQGDLIFISHPSDPIANGAKVGDPATSPTLVFESHALKSLREDRDLTLYRSEAKTPKNRLGFVQAPVGLRVDHPEHEDIESLPPGWYEIRRCKSWEANPKAIWSYSID